MKLNIKEGAPCTLPARSELSTFLDLRALTLRARVPNIFAERSTC